MFKFAALSFLLLLTIEFSWSVAPPVKAQAGGMYSPWPNNRPTIPEEDERADEENPLPDITTDDVLQIQDVDTNNLGTAIKDALQRYRVHTRALSWFDALTGCWREGGHLAIPQDDADARLLGHLLEVAVVSGKIKDTLMTDAMHIGIHNIKKDKSWSTVGGRDYAFSSMLKSSSPFSGGGDSVSGAILANGRHVYQTLREKLIYACDMKSKTVTEVQETIFNDDEGRYKRLAGPKLYNLHLSPLSWLEAIAECAKEGASLAQPANGREAGLLAGLLFSRSDANAELKRGGFFIGLNDIVDENNWKNLEGDFVYVDNWANGRPNGSRAANCAAMPFNGAYIDVPCGQPRAFLCEKKNVTEKPLYEKLGDFGLFAFHTVPRTWMEAMMKCRSENATLAVPESKEEAAAMAKLRDTELEEREIPHDDEIHVGVHDLDGDKRWTTTEGKRVLKSGFNEWTKNSQNMFHTACAALKNEKFENRACSTEAMYFCKKPEK